MRNVGHMRKIVIERFVSSQGQFGEPLRTWATHKTVYANIKPISGREVFGTDKDNSIRTVLFYMHFLKDISVKDRISYDGDKYDISYIREIGLRETLEVTGVVSK